MINIENALAIPGWMSEKELEWLAIQATSHTRIIEIGAWLGRSTRALADNTSGLVFTVDHWQGSVEHHQAINSNAFDRSLLDNHTLAKQFLCNTSNLLGTKLIPITGNSTEIASIFTTNIFDMVFIDGSHDQVSVEEDIAAWSRVLKNNGLLCGHDYCDAYKASVVKAVDNLVPNRKVVEGTSIWYDIIHWVEDNHGIA